MAEESRTRNVAVFAPLFPPAFRGGGPIRTLGALVSSSPSRFKVAVLTSDRDLGCAEPLPVRSNEWVSVGPARVYYASFGKLRAAVLAYLRVRDTRPDALYINSFFSPRFSIMPQLMWRVGAWGKSVRLVAPRGEFGSGALQRRTLKKRLYIWLYTILGLQRNVFWHASSEREARDIRGIWGEASKILIRTNETLLPPSASPTPPVAGERGVLHATFLGRIVEHKGLLILLLALKSVTRPVYLDVYGPEEDAQYARRCYAAAKQLPSNIRVRFLGPIRPEAVRSTIASYDLFLAPTAGENFGHVIAESLSVSCPILCTPYTSWNDVLKDGGGEVVPDRTISSWSTALQFYAELGAEDRENRRKVAGVAYDRWRQRGQGPHVFELLEDALAQRWSLPG